MNKANKVHWLVEDSVFKEEIGDIAQKISNAGMTVVIVKYQPFQSGVYQYYHKDVCVVSVGSINLIRQLQRESPWIPGSFANFQNFDCKTYMAHFGAYTLNSNYAMLPLQEFRRRFYELQSVFNSASIFVRPCDGYKSFTGQVLDSPDLLKHLPNYGTPELMVMCGPAFKTQQEFRFFVSGDDILTGSQYINADSQSEVSSEKTPEYLMAERFLQRILQEVSWRPDAIFAADIVMVGGSPFLLEFNSFSCSGWYACDKEILIKRASELALKEFNEVAS